MSDTATIAAIAEGLGWIYYRDPTEGDFVKGDDEYDTYQITLYVSGQTYDDKEGIWAFIRAVEAALSEAQQRAYGCILTRDCWPDDPSKEWTVESRNLFYFKIATAPASVRLACLRTVVRG